MRLESRKVLAFSSAAEIATSIASLVAPAIVVRLLLGGELAGVGVELGRCFGIALIALGLACWPSGPPAASIRTAARAMLAYNALIAMYLAYLSVVRHLDGMLLWPAVALHAVVALVLAFALNRERTVRTIAK